MDNAGEEGLSIAPDTPKDALDGQADAGSPSVSRPLNVRLVHVSIPSVSIGQVDDIQRPRAPAHPAGVGPTSSVGSACVHWHD